MNESGKTTVIKNYTSSSEATWKPTTAGTYKVYCKAKDSKGKIVYKILNYVIKNSEPIVINSFSTSKTSPQATGTNITLNVSATAQNSISYKYWAYNLGGSWTALSDFTTNSSINWIPKTIGKYLLGVDVKDSKGNIVSKIIEYNITDKVTLVQENNSKIKYSGKWNSYTNNSYSGKSKKRSYYENESLTFKFTGTGLSILSSTSNNYGVAQVTIDGVVYSVDMYSSKYKFQQEVFKVTGLTNKTHIITIKNVGLYSALSTGSIIDIDAFNIYNGNIV